MCILNSVHFRLMPAGILFKKEEKIWLFQKSIDLLTTAAEEIVCLHPAQLKALEFATFI